MAATILLTGATGLIGFRILLAALAAGHNVRYPARSEAKARAVASNPAVKKLAPGDHLSAFVIPDSTAAGVFDDALQGVTHIIHAGSPVAYPTLEPWTEVYEPTVKTAAELLSAALRSPGVQRVVMTSSIVANLGLGPLPTTEVRAGTRAPAPEQAPTAATAFGSVFEAYVLAKQAEMHETDELIRSRRPHFSIARIVPGYVFGRSELMLDAAMMRDQNSSNNFLMFCLTGGELPFPMHAVFAHLDDIAELHLRVALLDQAEAARGPADFALAVRVDFDDAFGYVEKAFPKAVAAGVFKKGHLPLMPVEYDSSDAQRLLGGKLRSFESAVVDVAGQYLEKLGMEKA
jgi:nucleoside-diphosphate-sugar epimerase